jgi:predicted  nucleic acid-binding Zn-ribbon protein
MSDEADKIDLAFIARAMRDLQSEVRVMRDDINVLAAMVQRMDGTMVGMINEIRAIHAQHSRMDRRVRELEAR